MSYHLLRSARHPHVVSPLPSIQVDEFFRSYSLSGQASFAGVRHDGIELVVDGWAAARAVAKHFPLEEDDEALAKILLEKVARTQDLAVDSLALVATPPDPHHAIQSSERFVSQFWRQVCTRLRPGSAIPPVATIRHPLTRGRFSGIDIRTREPLYCPLSSDLTNAPHGFRYLSSSSPSHRLPRKVPQSAIFFASLLFRLKVSAEKLFQLEQERNFTDRKGKSRVKAVTAEQGKIQREIFSELFAGSLYMAAATGPELGRTDLGFTPKAWFEELEKGTRLGSEIFGFEGLEKNCRFLKEHEALLRDFFDEAVEWWCPGAFEVHEEVGRVLELGLEVLFKELLQIFEHTFEMYAEDLSNGHSFEPRNRNL